MFEKELIKPTFIGVGGHKCASTWISECFRAHPEIFMSTPKEIHYFSGNWDKSIDWYYEHFLKSEDYKAKGEMSATYLQEDEAPERIFETLGKVQIIISLRNPIERFISHYKHLYRNGDIKNKHLTYNYFQEITKTYPNLLERGIYNKYINNYLEKFGKNNVFILLKDKLDESPKEEIKKLYYYLGVEEEFTPDIIEKKVSTGIIPNFQILETIRVKLYKILNRIAPISIIAIRKTRIMEIYRKLNNNNNELLIDNKVKDALLDFYKEDILDLEKTLNIDLDNWKNKNY